jgi:virginiamycin A acetyltransferase
MLRSRFSDEKIAALLEIAWRNWDSAKISRNLERIMAADVGALQAAT